MVDFISPNTGPDDPDDITADAIAFLQQQFPDWEPSDGNLEVWQIMALARIVSTATQVAGTVPLEIFKYFGQSVVGLQPIGALYATTTSTWTMTDDAGYTIPAGTNVGFQISGDVTIPFATVDDVIVPPGSLTTDPGGVIIQALDAGIAQNGLGPDGLVLIDALSFVDSITAVSATTGGLDGETDYQYASRLIDELQLAAPTPILGKDFGVMARNVPSVFRAVGIDNYNPADGTTDNERMVAVAAIDEQGTAASADVKTAIAAYLEGLRETNFIVNVFDPTYTVIDVVFTFVPYPGYDPDSVKQAAVNAIAALLNPATWGVDPGDDIGSSWTNTTILRYNSVVGALLAVDGLRWVDSLTLNGASADVALNGTVTLPMAGTITGTAETS